MWKHILEHPRFAKMSPSLKLSIIGALIAIILLLLPYIPLRWGSPPVLNPAALAPEPSARASRAKDLLETQSTTERDDGTRNVKERLPTPAGEDIRKESSGSPPEENSLDDLDSLLNPDDGQ